MKISNHYLQLRSGFIIEDGHRWITIPDLDMGWQLILHLHILHVPPAVSS